MPVPTTTGIYWIKYLATLEQTISFNPEVKKTWEKESVELYRIDKFGPYEYPKDAPVDAIECWFMGWDCPDYISASKILDFVEVVNPFGKEKSHDH